MRVLFGQDAHIVCTLALGTGYPHTGGIILNKLEGLDPTILVDTEALQV